jgi:hypothetical protein
MVIPFPAIIAALQRPVSFAILVRGQERATKVASWPLMSIFVQVPVNSQMWPSGQLLPHRCDRVPVDSMRHIAPFYLIVPGGLV